MFSEMVQKSNRSHSFNILNFKIASSEIAVQLPIYSTQELCNPSPSTQSPSGNWFLVTLIRVVSVMNCSWRYTIHQRGARNMIAISISPSPYKFTVKCS